MEADCKHGVDIPSTEMLTPVINNLFTLQVVGPKEQNDRVAEFAVELGKKKFGNVSKFSVALFGGEKRQQVNQWLRRGIPSSQHVNVAQHLGLTVEQLLAAGKIPVVEPDLPQEVIEFAKEWYRLPPVFRSQIQSLVHLMTMEMGRDGVHQIAPELQPRRRARSAGV